MDFFKGAMNSLHKKIEKLKNSVLLVFLFLAPFGVYAQTIDFTIDKVRITDPSSASLVQQGTALNEVQFDLINAGGDFISAGTAFTADFVVGGTVIKFSNWTTKLMQPGGGEPHLQLIVPQMVTMCFFP